MHIYPASAVLLNLGVKSAPEEFSETTLSWESKGVFWALELSQGVYGEDKEAGEIQMHNQEWQVFEWKC